jgi:hypothetical protein
LESSDTKRAMLVSCVISLARHPLTGPAVHRDPSAICSPIASCRTATASTNRVHERVRAGTATSQAGQPCAWSKESTQEHDVHLQAGGGSGIVCTAHGSSSCGGVFGGGARQCQMRICRHPGEAARWSRWMVLAPPQRFIFQSFRPPFKLVMMLGSRLFRGRREVS